MFKCFSCCCDEVKYNEVGIMTDSIIPASIFATITRIISPTEFTFIYHDDEYTLKLPANKNGITYLASKNYDAMKELAKMILNKKVMVENIIIKSLNKPFIVTGEILYGYIYISDWLVKNQYAIKNI
jgi:3-isopropylmalate dehydratase small subunit